MDILGTSRYAHSMCMCADGATKPLRQPWRSQSSATNSNELHAHHWHQNEILMLNSTSQNSNLYV